MAFKPFKILFVTESRELSVHDIAKGISRYVATHPELEIALSGLHFAYNDDITLKNYHPDGVIICSNRPEKHPSVRLKSVKAAVALHWWEKSSLPKTMPAFMNDDVEIARLAANHLIENKLKHFVYFHSDGAFGWDKARGKAFAEHLHKAGFECTFLPSDVQGTESWERNQMGDFLRSLPKPCGIFTSYDFVAKNVIDCCRANAIAVPEQVQVVGVDNADVICDNTIPTLTSIDVGFIEAGYAIAERLHQLLLGNKRGRRVVYFKPRAIVARGSTCDVRGIGRSVAAACEFMRVHALEPITPKHIATAVRSSLRSLQMNFKTVRNSGIAEHLRTIRLEHACRLLQETQMPLDQIPSYCHLGNPTSAKTLFKRTYGLSMSAYRRANQNQ